MAVTFSDKETALMDCIFLRVPIKAVALRVTGIGTREPMVRERDISETQVLCVVTLTNTLHNCNVHFTSTK